MNIKAMPLIKVFINSAGVLLLITACAKLLSGGGEAAILKTPDPIFGIPFRQVFLVVGAAELVIAMICLMGKSERIQTILVAWLSTCFLLYRFGLIWMGYHRPCACMGNLTDALGISSQVADNTMKMVLVYLLTGSYGVLWYLWLTGKKRLKPAQEAAMINAVCCKSHYH
jgi:hypothetical protein